MRRLFVLSLIVVVPLPLLAQPSRPREEPAADRAEEEAAESAESRAGEARRASDEARRAAARELFELQSRGARRVDGRGGRSSDPRTSARPAADRTEAAAEASDSRAQTDDDRRAMFQRMIEERQNSARAAERAATPERRTDVLSMRHASAAEVAAALGRALGNRRDVVVAAEPVSNTLLVSAPEEDFERTTATIRELARTLDRAPRSLSVEVAIVDFRRGGHVVGPFEGSLTKVVESWREDGVESVERVSLTTLEGLKTSVQIGASRAVPSGQSQGFAGGRGGAPTRITQYQQREFGTVVQLTGRVSGDEVVMDITVERSSLGDVAPREEGDEEPSSPPEMTTLDVRSTIRAAAGEVVLVGSRGSDDHIVAVLASVRIAGVREEEAADNTGRAGRGSARGDRGARTTTPGGTRELKIFTLRNAEASSLASVLRDVVGGARSSLNIGVDTRTNALVVAGDESSLRTIEALITRLDSADDE